MPRRVVIHVNIDGVSEDMLYNALAGGKLPALKDAFDGGLRTRGAVTILPSTTIPAQTSIHTGSWPGRHTVHSFRIIRRGDHPPSFFNFEDMDNALGYYGYKLFGLPDGLLPHVSEIGTVDERISTQTPTVYEEARRHGFTSAVGFHMVMRGATRRILPRKATFIKYALAHEGYGAWRSYDQDLVYFGLEDLNQNGLCDFTTYYFAGLDASGHYVGGNKAQEQYLINDIEPMWADLYAGIQAKLGQDEPLFVLSSDHGHNDYKGDEAHAVGTKRLHDLFRSYGYKVVDEFSKPVTMEGCDLAICSGLGKLFIYVRRPDAEWVQPPDIEKDVLPVARRIVEAQGFFGPFLNHMLVKDRKAGVYRVLELSEKDHRLIPIETWYADKEELFPDAVARIRGLYYSDSPDLVVFPNDFDGFCFSDYAHKSGHGSLYGGCSRVPVLMAGRGVAAQEVTGARVIDIMPTAANWLGFDMPHADGKVLWQNQPAQAVAAGSR